MGDRSYSFDANMALADAAAAQTVSGFAQNLGADGMVDFGGNQGITITLPSIADVASLVPQQARIDAMLVIDVTARDIASGDEQYRFTLVGSNDPAFAVGTGVCLAQYELGKGTAMSFPNGKDVPAVPGSGGLRFEIPFAAEQAGVKLQFAKLHCLCAGTTPSITYRAFVAVAPEC